ncbi:hypothetical protein [Streptomyces lincolnensis]|uniref:hypothetical protein n=1 Tax=Streptomyces lincolnensis TaxID=1915 RepID=UPI0037D53B2B
MSTERSLPRRRRAWLRVLVLLVALVLPGAHTGTHAAPATPPAGEAIEYDLLDTALRLPARAARRPVVPLRPAPRPEAAPGVPAGAPLPAVPRPSYTLVALRTVVLRC